MLNIIDELLVNFMWSYKRFSKGLSLGQTSTYFSLESDLAFGAPNILICTSVWKNALGPQAGLMIAKGNVTAWKGDAPMLLFSNRIQLWISLSLINVSECWLNAMRRSFLVWQYPAFLLPGLGWHLSNSWCSYNFKMPRKRARPCCCSSWLHPHPCMQGPSYITCRVLLRKGERPSACAASFSSKSSYSIG